MTFAAPASRAQMEAAHRAASSATPPALIVNAEAVDGLIQPTLRFRGLAIPCAPLRFRDGFRLATCPELAPTADVVALLGSLVLGPRPAGRLAGRRWDLGNPFRGAGLDELQAVVAELLSADATNVPVPTGASGAVATVDQLRRVGEFALHCPWGVGLDGLPVYWRTYLHGLRWIDQERARAALAAADAAGAGFGGDSDGAWRNAQRATAYGRI